MSPLTVKQPDSTVSQPNCHHICLLNCHHMSPQAVGRQSAGRQPAGEQPASRQAGSHSRQTTCAAQQPASRQAGSLLRSVIQNDVSDVEFPPLGPPFRRLEQAGSQTVVGSQQAAEMVCPYMSAKSKSVTLFPSGRSSFGKKTFFTVATKTALILWVFNL